MTALHFVLSGAASVEPFMPLFSFEEIVKVTGARELAGRPKVRGGIRRLCTDSRDVRTGDVFLPLAGERFDGHRFVAAALRRGAIGALVQRGATLDPRPPARSWLLEVPDTLRAYQDLAAFHRRRFAIPVIAVTGSNGKTTTKDMIADVLMQRWRTLKTEGNLNNRVGVPRTLLRLHAGHRAAVIEMGVDHPGQTTRLCEIAQPTVGIITNIGPDHLEFFGTLETSARAKGELLDFIPADGALVLNADDDFYGVLAARASGRVVAFGLSEQAQVRAVDVEHDARQGLRFHLVLPGRTRGVRVTLPAHGLHNLANALGAAAVGHALGVSAAAIVKGLARFKPAAMRSQVVTMRGVRVVDDCYNANPASMEVAIDLLAALAGSGRSIAVLGDMLELGPETQALHRQVGAHVGRRRVSTLIVAGTLGRAIAEGARAGGMRADQIHEAADAEEAGQLAARLARKGDVVLVKASRGMRLESVVEALRQR